MFKVQAYIYSSGFITVIRFPRLGSISKIESINFYAFTELLKPSCPLTEREQLGESRGKGRAGVQQDTNWGQHDQKQSCEPV